MDIRLKALGKMLAYITVIFGGNYAINWLFPLYGTTIALSIVLVYIMYMMYSIILSDMERGASNND